MATSTQQTSNGTRCRTPVTNFVEHENSYGLEIEMPGVDRANIEMNIEGRELEIVAEKTVAPNEWRAVHRETVHCVYRRTFTLGDEIDRDSITATYKNGVLYVTLAKSKAVLPKRIEIA